MGDVWGGGAHSNQMLGLTWMIMLLGKLGSQALAADPEICDGVCGLSLKSLYRSTRLRPELPGPGVCRSQLVVKRARYLVGS